MPQTSRSAAAGRIVVAGEALVDDLPPLTPGEPRRLVPGGAPVNVAVAAARLGAKVAFAGPLGDDDAGELLRRHLRDAGVPSLVPAVPRPTARAVVSLDADGHPSYEFTLEGSACRTVSILPGRVRSAAALVIVGGAVGLNEHPLGASLSLLPGAVDAPIWFDPNVRSRVLGTTDGARRRYAAMVDGVIAEVDLVKCSDEDIALLHGPDVDPVEVATTWAASGPALVVLTRGAKGLMAVTPGGHVVEVPAPDVDADARDGGDTVGAGDTVTGALLAWAMRNDALTRGGLRSLNRPRVTEALEFAAKAAAVTVTRPGADPPTSADLA